MTFWVAGAAVVGGIASSAIGSSAAQSAASQQAGAARNAQDISQNEFNTITQQENPFVQSGYGSQEQLNYLLGIGQPGTPSSGGIVGSGGALGAPGTPGTASSSTAGGYGSLLKPFDMNDFEQLSPAYNFQKQQGTQGVLNADASGSGSMSGSALKDLTNYNQNLANTSFNNAFNQYQTQQGNIFSRLSGVANLGQNAAANTGQQGTALAGQAAQSATNIGTANAAGTIGSANAITGGISSVAPWLAYGAGGSGSGGGSPPINYGSNVTSSDGYTYAPQE